LELDGRREIGVIVKDAKIARQMQAVFETDWARTTEGKAAPPPKEREKEKERAISGA
jgi:phosphatidylserine/phosphatidylglycerophosphate/cardiolipin synthase-like enzyme